MNYAKNELCKLNLIILPTPRIRFLTLPSFIFLMLFIYVGNLMIKRQKQKTKD